MCLVTSFSLFQLSAVLSRELEGQGVKVLTERLAFTGGLDDTSEVVQQLNVRAHAPINLYLLESIYMYTHEVA